MKTSKYYDEALTMAGAGDANLKKVQQLLRRAYRQGDDRAAYALGTWYLHGKGSLVSKNLKKAIPLLREAADGQHADAAFDLAVCYENGIGVKKNERKAVALYLQAALLGEKQAVYEVGRCYWHGIGVERDRLVSKIWLDHARRSGIKT